MNAWWIGTVSTLAGAVTAALLQAWRERVAHQRALHTRWDQQLVLGLVDYLATADRAVRALLRWRHATRERNGGVDEAKEEALVSFEALHEKSQVITLLTGGRDDPVRAAARSMREPLLPMRDELVGSHRLSEDEVKRLVSQHRDGRAQLIRAAQSRLRVTVRFPGA